MIDTKYAPFALFVGSTFYPQFGWRGYKDQFKTLEEAKTKGNQLGKDWWQVLDVRTMEMVAGEGAGSLLNLWNLRIRMEGELMMFVS